MSDETKDESALDQLLDDSGARNSRLDSLRMTVVYTVLAAVIGMVCASGSALLADQPLFAVGYRLSVVKAGIAGLVLGIVTMFAHRGLRSPKTGPRMTSFLWYTAAVIGGLWAAALGAYLENRLIPVSWRLRRAVPGQPGVVDYYTWPYQVSAAALGWFLVVMLIMRMIGPEIIIKRRQDPDRELHVIYENVFLRPAIFGKGKEDRSQENYWQSIGSWIFDRRLRPIARNFNPKEVLVTFLERLPLAFGIVAQGPILPVALLATWVYFDHPGWTPFKHWFVYFFPFSLVIVIMAAVAVLLWGWAGVTYLYDKWPASNIVDDAEKAASWIGKRVNSGRTVIRRGLLVLFLLYYLVVLETPGAIWFWKHLWHDQQKLAILVMVPAWTVSFVLWRSYSKSFTVRTNEFTHAGSTFRAPWNSLDLLPNSMARISDETNSVAGMIWKYVLLIIETSVQGDQKWHQRPIKHVDALKRSESVDADAMIAYKREQLAKAA